jgi:hypothetical protein
MEDQMNTGRLETAALSLEQLDAVSGGHMSADGKTFSVIVWKTGDTKYGFSVSSDGTACTTTSGPNGHGSSCTVPV